MPNGFYWWSLVYVLWLLFIRNVGSQEVSFSSNLQRDTNIIICLVHVGRVMRDIMELTEMWSTPKPMLFLEFHWSE